MIGLNYEDFSEIDLSDQFFNSLIEDYEEFEKWFKKKSNTSSEALVFRDRGNNITGFLYTKIEDDKSTSLKKPLPDGKILKVGTLKINAHGTKLGERFVKKIFDIAMEESADYAYVTVFPKHLNLIKLLSRYGFIHYTEKETVNGTELVLLKSFTSVLNDPAFDFPLINFSEKKFFLLAIYPEFHSKFLTQSILNNEDINIVQDVSSANSIYKCYISGLARVKNLKKGDVLVIYRTNDKKGKAYYRSVATSICVVEEVKQIQSFESEQEFSRYVKRHSVFDEDTLKELYLKKKRRYVIKFTYNVALKKRIIRGRLIEECGISTKSRWDFIPLTRSQVTWILKAGNVSENFIVN